MGVFENFSRFLETRLEEFLRNNPHLELEALDEQLREQEEGTIRLIKELQFQEKKLQDDILATAQEIQRWHSRIDKAKAAARLDLAHAAQEREAALLRQGNQLWGQMQGYKERLQKANELLPQIQLRRQEVKAKYAEVQAARAKYKSEHTWETTGWNQNYKPNINQADSLDEQFRRWEADEELERLKRQMGK